MSIQSFALDYVKRGADILGESDRDLSGHSVSLSADGSIVAVGAHRNDKLFGNGTGHVRVYGYDENSGAWRQRGNDIDGEADLDGLGYSVSLSASGSIVAIGVPFSDKNGGSSGHASIYVYDVISNAWIQRGNDILGEAASDNSGRSVSLSEDGRVVAIGANNNDGNGTTSGHVRVYMYDVSSGAWRRRGGDIDGEAAGDESGHSVALSADGSIVAVGAPYNDGNGTDSGHVRVYAYDFNSGAWRQRGGDIDGEVAGDELGHSVSLSADGSVVAIGAPYNDENGDSSGSTRVYTYNEFSGAWIQRGADIDGAVERELAGTSVTLSSDGNILGVGAPNYRFFGSREGLARVYAYDDVLGAWIQLGTDIESDVRGDRFGHSISLSDDGDVLALGAPESSPREFLFQSGSTHIFAVSNAASETPSIKSPVWNRISGFSSTLGVQAGCSYRIQWSNNLIDWFDLANIVPESTGTPFHDPEFDGTETRFYRVVSP